MIQLYVLYRCPYHDDHMFALSETRNFDNIANGIFSCSRIEYSWWNRYLHWLHSCCCCCCFRRRSMSAQFFLHDAFRGKHDIRDGTTRANVTWLAACRTTTPWLSSRSWPPRPLIMTPNVWITPDVNGPLLGPDAGETAGRPLVTFLIIKRNEV